MVKKNIAVYINSIRTVIKKGLKEPNQWLMVSVVVVLLSLPIITGGIAKAVGLALTKQWVGGYGIALYKDVKDYLKQYAKRAMLLSIIEVILLLLTILAGISVGKSSIPSVVRFSFSVSIMVNLVMLLIISYAWSVLIYNNINFVEAVKYGANMVVLFPLTTILMLGVWLLVVAISVVSVIGVFAVLPGFTLLMQAIMYEKIIAYCKENQEVLV